MLMCRPSRGARPPGCGRRSAYSGFRARIRHHRVVAGDPLDRGEQLVRPAPATRAAISAPKPPVSGASCTITSGRCCATESRIAVAVERLQRRDVDDLGLDPLRCQLIGRFQGLLDHRAPGDERDVAPSRSTKHRLERQSDAVVGDLLARGAVEPGRLEKHHRVGIADGGQQQAIGARRRRRDHDPQTRDMREHRLRAFGMVLDAPGCRRPPASAGPSGRSAVRACGCAGARHG